MMEAVILYGLMELLFKFLVSCISFGLQLKQYCLMIKFRDSYCLVMVLVLIQLWLFGQFFIFIGERICCFRLLVRQFMICSILLLMGIWFFLMILRKSFIGFLMIVLIMYLLKKCLFLNSCWNIGVSLKLWFLKVCVSFVMMFLFILGCMKVWQILV